MNTSFERARIAILEFQDGVGLFRTKVENAKPTRQLPAKRLTKLLELAEEATSAALPLLDSLRLIELTGLDVVDMETRMMGESKELSRVLQELGGEVSDQHFIRVEFEDELVDLEERAQSVAGSFFPSAVQGLNLVNSKLWEFSRLQMSLYRRMLKEIVEKEKLTARAQQEVEATFAELEEHFGNSNRFLNQLALRELSKRDTITTMSNVKRGLRKAGEIASKAVDKKTFRHFKSILKDSRQVAKEVAERLDALRIPLFPPHEELEEVQMLIEPKLYEELTGLQTFALLNIASCMRDIKLDGGHLLSPKLHIQIWKVFPDRIYFDADSKFLDAVKKTGAFEVANPALHRFREGSFKQNTYPQGNLQVSYQNKSNGRLSVDADIDLYRDPLLHFFGEVLVNHLTGSKTDPYRVQSILDQQGAVPIGRFEIYSA